MNENLPASPLRDIIRRQMEKKVVGPIETRRRQLAHRMERATDVTFILCDVSISMEDHLGGMRKIDHLKSALRDLVRHYPKVRIISFGSRVAEVQVSDIKEPNGGTPLAQALNLAAQSRPKKTIVISDGMPDNTEAAVAAAQAMTGEIDTIYCGPESHPAVMFMQSISRLSGGEQRTWDAQNKELGTVVRGLLPPPE